MLGAAAGGALIPTITRVVIGWAAAWRAASDLAEDGDWELPGELAKGCVGLITDVVQTFGADYARPHFAPHIAALSWVFAECHKWEVQDGKAPAETTAAFARARLGLPAS